MTDPRTEALRLRAEERLSARAIANQLGYDISTIYNWLGDGDGMLLWADDMSDSRRARWYKQQSDEQIAVLEAHGVWYGPGKRPQITPAPPEDPEPAQQICETPAQVIHNITAACADYVGVGIKELADPCRNKAVSDARMAAAYLAHKHSRLGVAALGRKFGRDHSTIMSALKRVEGDLERGGARFEDMLHHVEARLGLRP